MESRPQNTELDGKPASAEDNSLASQILFSVNQQTMYHLNFKLLLLLGHNSLKTENTELCP